MRKINKIILHCSDSSFGSADVIRRWHLERGWSDIGYHYVVCNGYENKSDDFEALVHNGKVEPGRPLEIAGAHARGHNKDSVGICMIGTNKFTEEQFIALGALVISLMVQFDLSAEDIIGHNEVSSKTCPNFDVSAFIDKYVLG